MTSRNGPGMLQPPEVVVKTVTERPSGFDGAYGTVAWRELHAPAGGRVVSRIAASSLRGPPHSSQTRPSTLKTRLKRSAQA